MDDDANAAHDEIQERVRNALIAQGQRLSSQLAAIRDGLQRQADEEEQRRPRGKRVYVELMDGKYDGLLLDSKSGDATERMLAEFVYLSHGFEVIDRVESDTEIWMQLRQRKDAQSSS